MTSFTSGKDVLKFAKEEGCKVVDFKFVDLLGQWQHTSMPIAKLLEETFTEGYNFDGSSIRGWKAINESDMTFVPDFTTATIDPFFKEKTLSLICDIQDAVTRQPYARDPRYIARKAELYLKQTGIGDVAFFGPEPEFFVFDNIQFGEGPNQSYYKIDSAEGRWNAGRDEGGSNLGYKTDFKRGYFPVPPIDTFQDLRVEMALALQSVGIEVEVFHHEVATAGQNELSMKFNQLTKMADQTLWYKHVVKNVARRAGKTATFMPKPIFGDNGSGMHVHQSIWKNEKPLFAGDEYAGLSETALYYIGGLLKHAPSLLAITNPGLNSYRRLVPGFEAPVNLAYSSRNRSASVRIPVVNSAKAKRLEFRCPDATTNPYLAFAAMLLAGIDGIQNKIKPGAPLDKDIYALSPEELKDIPKAPGSLEESINNLKKDHAFLLKGDVFTPEVIHEWIGWKEENEIKPNRLRPTSLEFQLYYDN
jgi:glutamine synthetase